MAIADLVFACIRSLNAPFTVHRRIQHWCPPIGLRSTVPRRYPVLRTKLIGLALTASGNSRYVNILGCPYGIGKLLGDIGSA